MVLAQVKNNDLACLGSFMDEKNVTLLKCDRTGSYSHTCVTMRGITQVQKWDVTKRSNFAEHQGMVISQTEKPEGSIYSYRRMGI